jgi:uncharacterized protein YndB with AHSA1/START domain
MVAHTNSWGTKHWCTIEESGRLEGERGVFTRTVSGPIARPIEEVFAFLGDPRNRPRWEVPIEKSELTSPEPVGVGTTARTTQRIQDTRFFYDWEVLEHQPPARQVVRSTAGPVPTTLAVQLGERDGGTWVELRVTGQPGGRLRPLQPVIAYRVNHRLHSSFGRLKRALESRAVL